MLLKDRVALVTGSTHNIGLATARAFAREGAKVVVHSRHQEDARRIAGEIGGDSFAADVSRPEQIDALFDHIGKNHGRLDILVNSVAHSSKHGILDLPLEEWNQIMATNLTGYFLCIQHAARMMKSQGLSAPRWARTTWEVASRNTTSFRCVVSAGLKKWQRRRCFWPPTKRATSRTPSCRLMAGV